MTRALQSCIVYTNRAKRKELKNQEVKREPPLRAGELIKPPPMKTYYRVTEVERQAESNRKVGRANQG